MGRSYVAFTLWHKLLPLLLKIAAIFSQDSNDFDKNISGTFQMFVFEFERSFISLQWQQQNSSTHVASSQWKQTCCMKMKAKKSTL